MTLTERINRMTDKSGGEETCWVWKGSTNHGYGKLNINSVQKRAHRIVWEIACGRPVPEGMVVRHKCDNPLCVNPGHLEVGTYRDNALDMVARGRTKGTPNEPKVVVSDSGHRFISIKRAAEFFTTSPGSIRKAIRTGGQICGVVLRYENPEDKSRRGPRSRPVKSLDGELIFPSINQMAKFYGAPHVVINRIITKGTVFRDRKWVFDVGQ